MKVSVNQLIRWGSNLNGPTVSRIERILFIDVTGTDVAAIDVDKERAIPVWYKYKDVEVALNASEACILQVDHRTRPNLTVSDLDRSKNKKIKDVRDRRWEVIESLVIGENVVKMLFPRERAALVRDRTKVKFTHGAKGSEIHHSRQSIYHFVYL